MTQYATDAFYGRVEFSDAITRLLLADDAHQRRQRSILIEGPAGRGKTWFLEHIAASLMLDPTQPLVCFYEAKDLPDPSTALLKQTTHLCHLVQQRLGKKQWPLDLFDPSDDDQRVAELLQGFPIGNILDQLGAQIAEHSPSTMLIVIVDGLEEQSEECIHRFEKEFIEPLFRFQNVRLLASRRVESPMYRWLKYSIAGQTQVKALLGFDSAPEQPDQPHLRQIEHLVRTYLAPVTDIITSVEQMLGCFPAGTYSWGNPRANKLLVAAALAHTPIEITQADIRGGVLTLLAPPRTIPSLWDEHEVFERLHVLVREHPKLAEDDGVMRFQLSQTLGLPDAQRDQFLGYLQTHGVGFFRRNGAFVVYPEFVQLLRFLL